jgi:hypothetical protein
VTYENYENVVVKIVGEKSLSEIESILKLFVSVWKTLAVHAFPLWF